MRYGRRHSATCPRCGVEFQALAGQTYCGFPCGRVGRPGVPFWDRVDRSGGPEACWPWTGGRRKGYGILWFNGRSRPAHVVAYTLSGGELAEGQVVRHRCDNPPCCNPAHLLSGTQADNVADMMARHRHVAARGLWNGAVTHPESRPRGDQHWARRRKAAREEQATCA